MTERWLSVSRRFLREIFPVIARQIMIEYPFQANGCELNARRKESGLGRVRTTNDLARLRTSPSLSKYTSNSARASSITFGAAIGRNRSRH